MANTQERKFKPDENVTWMTLEGQTWTKRQVAVRSQKGNRATIAWGFTAEGNAKLYDVPLSQLSRNEPPSNVPIYHQAPITPYQPPEPPSESQLQRRLSDGRASLIEAHEHSRRARDVVRSTSELVTRANGEFEASRAALLGLDAKIRSESTKLERALRAGETPPEMQPAPDRGVIVQRVQATEAALRKFQAEDREAQARLGQAMGGIRGAAVGLLTIMIEVEIERLRQGEEAMLLFRAGLQKVVEWAGASGTALPLSAAAAAVLGSFGPDRDRAKFMGGGAVPRWERLLKQLIEDPTADFAEEPVTDTAAQAAE